VDEGTKMKGEETVIGTGVRQITATYKLVLKATPIKLCRKPFYAARLAIRPGFAGKTASLIRHKKVWMDGWLIQDGRDENTKINYPATQLATTTINQVTALRSG
jgi:hypothetical protein